VVSGHRLHGFRRELALIRVVQHILYSGSGSGSDSPGPAGGTSAPQTPAEQQAAAKKARRLKCARFWLALFRKSAVPQAWRQYVCYRMQRGWRMVMISRLAQYSCRPAS
jgi:hypothetical protein